MPLSDTRPRRDWLGSDTMDTQRIGPLDVITHVVIHYAGQEWQSIPDTRALLRDVNNWSNNANGYPFAYSWAVGRAGDAWTARNFDYRNYANDGDHGQFRDINFNYKSVSIYVIYDSDEAPTQIQLDRVARLVVQIERELGRELILIGHRDSDFTPCPGDHLYALLPEIRRLVLQHRNPSDEEDTMSVKAELFRFDDVRSKNGELDSATFWWDGHNTKQVCAGHAEQRLYESKMRDAGYPEADVRVRRRSGGMAAATGKLTPWRVISRIHRNKYGRLRSAFRKDVS